MSSSAPYGLIPQFAYKTITYILYLLFLFSSIYFIGNTIIDYLTKTEASAKALHRYKDFLFFGDLLLCFCLYIAIMIRFLIKQQKYITYLIDMVHLIKGGNYTQQTEIRGNNELSHLAMHIDELRKTVSVDKENQRIQNEKQQLLLTSISHDLRTPLTTLRGYLEILQEHDFQDQQRRKKYLAHCLERTKQLEYLTSRAFEHFYLTGKENCETELLRCNSYRSLSQILFRCAHILHQNGYHLQSELPKCRYSLVYDTRMMERLFDNIFTNVVRYADYTHPISILGELDNDNLKIYVKNKIGKAVAACKSSGIGLQNCEKIMKIHGGEFFSEFDENMFIASIIFPIKNKG